MNEQFINDVMDYIKAECPEYYSVTHITNRQYNGKELQGIVIQDTTKPNNVAPILGDYNSATCLGYTVSWKPVTTERFDSKGFKEAEPELYAKFVKTSTSRRFSVK